MPVQYTDPDQTMVDALSENLAGPHARLRAAGVRVALVVARCVAPEPKTPPKTERARTKAAAAAALAAMRPAIKVRGQAAAARVRITTSEQRAVVGQSGGSADAIVTICGSTWDRLTTEEREALIDHELTHLLTTHREGELVLDDVGRPKLKIRHHDVEFGFFDEVVGRHGEASPERVQLRAWGASDSRNVAGSPPRGQLYLPWAGEDAPPMSSPAPAPKAMSKAPLKAKRPEPEQPQLVAVEVAIAEISQDAVDFATAARSAIAEGLAKVKQADFVKRLSALLEDDSPTGRPEQNTLRAIQREEAARARPRSKIIDMLEWEIDARADGPIDDAALAAAMLLCYVTAPSPRLIREALPRIVDVAVLRHVGSLQARRGSKADPSLVEAIEDRRAQLYEGKP